VPYHCTLPVRLRHTDAAGVLFFAEQLALAHEAYEAFLDEHDLSVGTLLASGSGVPIVSCEASYEAPVRVGDRLTFTVTAERVGETSFTLTYGIDRDKVPVGRCQTVHVSIGKDGAKRPLSDAMRAALTSLA
jgi:acyl-CoA thioesterase FadM